MDFKSKYEEIIREQANFPVFLSFTQTVMWFELANLVAKFTNELNALPYTRIGIQLNQDSGSLALLITTLYVNANFTLIPSFYSLEKVRTWFKSYEIECFIVVNDNVELQIQDETTPGERTASQFIGLMTSGTTGVPKISRHTWDSLTSQVQNSPKFLGKKWLLCYPYAHFAGIQVLVQCLHNGGTIVVPSDSRQIGGIYQLMMQFQPDYLNGTPTLIRQLLMNFNKSEFATIKLKSITLGGEMVDQQTIDHIKQYLPKTHVSHIYASTEIGASIKVNDEREGFPLSLIDGRRIKIQNGKLFIKRKLGSMQGYLGKDDLKKDEWVDTHDLVEATNDRVLFRGREDDLINIGGFKVSPIFVETVIKELSDIKDVLVLGEKNFIAGNIIKTILLVDHHVEKNELIKKIVSHCKLNLPYYMVPKLFDFVDEIPSSLMHKKVRQ